ncbi:MAG: AAA family ATPase [Gemmatimonadales bacterium]
MTDSTARATLISTDPSFRSVVKDVVLGPDVGFTLGLELTSSFAEFGEQEIQALRAFDPALIILDLESDPELGVRFAQFIAEQSPERRFIAAGPLLSPELLLEAMRAGVADYLVKPVTVEQLRPAVERMSNRLGRPVTERPRQPGVVYSFTSAKGGGGSTTLSANLAIILHQLTGKKTLLVDLELQMGEVALMLGIQPRFNFVDLVQNFSRMDAGLLASFIERHSSGVHVLSAPYHPERAEGVTVEQIRRILGFLSQNYDYVLIDTSKSLLPSTLAAFEQSDVVFVVTNPDLPSLRNIQRGLPLIRRAMIGSEQQFHLVVNRYNGADAIPQADIERTLGLKVFWTLSNDYEAVITSINTGTPVVLHGNSRYARDLRALGAELAGLRSRNGRSANPFRRLWTKVNKPQAKEAKADE